MAYSFTLLALPDLMGALLTFLMLYLLVKFGPENRVNLVLGLYVFFAMLASLTYAGLLLTVDEKSALPWRVYNDISTAVGFPLMIHFLLLYMDRGRWFTGQRFHPLVLYTPAIFQLFFMQIHWFFEILYLFWIFALALVLVISMHSLRGEPNPFQRAQKLLVFLFALLPFVWLFLQAIVGRFIIWDFTWTAGYFFSASAGIAIYAMLRYQMLDTKIVLRGGLVALITSMIIGVVFFTGLRLICWLCDIPLQREESLVAVAIVVVVSWFFNPLFGAGTRLLEWMAPDLKWKECRLEQVFLMDYNGIRVASARRAGSDVDIDLAGGMLTAVQDFLRHAFHADKKDSVRKISIGKYRLLVEHAPPVYMAIVLSGDETPELRRDVRNILDLVLQKHGKRLEGWDGNRAGFEDVERMLADLIGRSSGKTG